MKTYEILFDILSRESDYISGEKLAQELGISRTSIWKAIQHLEKEGIPVQGKDHLMFLEKGVKSKEGRRQKVQEKTNLVMLLGDNLVDFADFSKTSADERGKKLEELKKEFGEKFIIFPNPMYGSWESTVYKGKKLDAKGQTEERQKALQGYK